MEGISLWKTHLYLNMMDDLKKVWNVWNFLNFFYENVILSLLNKPEI